MEELVNTLIEQNYIPKLLSLNLDVKIPERFENIIIRSILKFGHYSNLLCVIEEFAEYKIAEENDDSDKTTNSFKELLTEFADVILVMDTIRFLYNIDWKDMINVPIDNSVKAYSTSGWDFPIAISHYERGRITMDDLCRRIKMVYHRLEMKFLSISMDSLTTNDFKELLTKELCKKYEKFERQVA